MHINEKKESIINILVIIGSALFVWMWSDKSCGVIYSILGGIEIENHQINLLKLGKWLFIFAVYFFIFIKKLTDNRKTRLLSLYRYESFKDWWKCFFLNSQLSMFGIYIINCLFFYVLEFITNNHSNHIIEIIFIFYVHLATLLSIIIACNQIITKSIIPCVLIILEGIAYLLSVQYSLLILSCGMYSSMSKIDNKCMVIIAVLAQLLISGISYSTVVWLWKKDNLDVIG